MADADGLQQQIASLHAATSALMSADVDGIDALLAGSLHTTLRAVADQAQLLAARLLHRVEADGRWEASGARTFPQWAARQRSMSVGAARQEAALGRALDADLTSTGRAVADGQITLEHAQVLARLAPTSDARRAALRSDRADRNETYLLDRARRTGVDEYRREVRRWAIRVDAEAAEAEHERAQAKEYLTFSRREDGVTFQGFLTLEHGTALQTALRAITGVPAADDTRSADERNATALAGLARVVLDQGLAGGGAQVRPHLSVHVPWETFQALEGNAGPSAEQGAGLAPAELEDGEPITPGLLARLACDSEVTRIVFGPTGSVLDVGRAHRTYSGQLRRAVVARDRSCRYPGCSAPPRLGEIHHVEPWNVGGRTSVANGILLCWHHHDLVHRRHLVIHRSETGWTVRRPGDEVTYSAGTATWPGAPPARGTPRAGERTSDHGRQVVLAH
ncbi:HNH endonuclease signature motif containing protein [Actinotalea sp. K2]|uniref:HNH endonuclease signature motif containing protein n=1 Tax=Actinotalea sp. K2 TaxID=2939438 RepID=UPI002016A7F1|nr:HNH endonuclease signature motif containing protein [Actinotalea sp. K2]MCL3862907.1 HNH endonuclease [Actinotalea sp. K2]